MVVAWKGTDTKKDVLCWKVRGISDPGGTCGKTIACGQRQLFDPVASHRKSQSRFSKAMRFSRIYSTRNPIHAVGVMCANASVVL